MRTNRIERALEAAEAGNKRWARVLADACLEKYKHDTAAHIDYAYVLAEGLNEVDEAKAHLENALRMDPMSWRVHTNIAVLHSKYFNNQEARHHFKKALEYQPDAAETHYQYAKFLASENNHIPAREHFNRAKSLSPNELRQFEDYDEWIDSNEGWKRPSENSSGPNFDTDTNPQVDLEIPDEIKPDPVESPPQLEIDLSNLTHLRELHPSQTTTIHRVQLGSRDDVSTAAIKHPSSKGTMDSNDRHRYEREAKLMSELDHHPHVTGVIDYGISDIPWTTNQNPTVWIALEDMDRGSLSEKCGAISVEKAIWITKQIAKTLHEIHLNEGYKHLDIKPSNILFRKTEPEKCDYPKIADWEIATPTADSIDSHPVGSPRYAAPEQVQDEKLDQRTDQFQTGVLCYELLTGEHPFIEGDESLHSHARASASIRKEPTPIDEYLPSSPDGLWEVIEKTLAVNKEDRFDKMDDFVDSIS